MGEPTVTNALVLPCASVPDDLLRRRFMRWVGDALEPFGSPISGHRFARPSLMKEIRLDPHVRNNVQHQRGHWGQVFGDFLTMPSIREAYMIHYPTAKV